MLQTLMRSMYCLFLYMIHHRGFYFISEPIFVLSIHTETSLSETDFFSFYLETMPNSQRIFTFVK